MVPAVHHDIDLIAYRFQLLLQALPAQANVSDGVRTWLREFSRRKVQKRRGWIEFSELRFVTSKAEPFHDKTFRRAKQVCLRDSKPLTPRSVVAAFPPDGPAPAGCACSADPASGLQDILSGNSGYAALAVLKSRFDTSPADSANNLRAEADAVTWPHSQPWMENLT